MIELKNISKEFKKYKQRILVLKNISIKFDCGKFYSIMGPSGSGKSTLLNIIGLLDKPTSGFLLINNNDFNTYTEKQKDTLRLNKIGYVFQDCYMSENLNVYENVMLPLLINNELSFKEKDYIVKKLLRIVKLENRIDHFSNELSGGEKQRVAIARALVNNPDIILADEPTGNLDKNNEEIIFEILKKLSKSGKCVITVSHNTLIKKYADEIFYMDNGILVEEI